MKSKHLPETCYRAGNLKTAGDPEDRTVELSFASDAIVDRGYYREQLVVSAGAVLLDRLRTEGALKLTHFGDQVGKVRKVWIDGGKVRARVELSRSQRALEVLQDIRDEIRTGVSVAYVVHDSEDVQTPKGPPLVRVTRWEPIHISLEAEPADITVGTVRSLRANHKQESGMQKNDNPDAGDGGISVGEDLAELRRRENIRAFAAQMDGLPQSVVTEHIARGTSYQDFRMEALEAIGRRSRPSTSEIRDPGPMGLRSREANRFSVLRLLRHLANEADVNLRQAASYEIGLCREWSQQSRRVSKLGGATVPPDIFMRTLDLGGGSGTGAGLVGTEHMPGEYIDALYPHSIAVQLCRHLTGLVGDASVPYSMGRRTAGWVGEDDDAPISNAAVSTKDLKPKSLAIRDYVTRKMLIQSSPSADALVLNDLLAAIGSGLDLALLVGTGIDDQPAGIVTTSGVIPVLCGNGTAGGAPDFSDIIRMETKVAQANAESAGMAYIVPADVRGFLKTTETAAGSGVFIWQDQLVAGVNGVPTIAGVLNGHRAFVSNQLPEDGTFGSSVGICSTLVYGDFQQALLGAWGGIDINVDRSTASAKGGVWLVCFQDADVLIRRPTAFAVCKDALC